jgi:mannose/fructose/N-acetylgalactosamine-specific phosphotransferase system component IIC
MPSRKADEYFLSLFLAGFAAAAAYLLNLPSFAYLIIGALFACTVLYIHQVQPTAQSQSPTQSVQSADGT